MESVDHAVAAERGGAHRLELCSDLSSGGITPSAGLMQTARRYAKVPIHVLIRPRPGDFCYSDRELEIMRCDIQTAKQLGMDGIVLGVLHANNRVDIAQTKALVQLARPLPVTFHRAFDTSPSLETSLEDVIQTGASRILTSGGASSAMEAVSTLARLVQLSRGRILVMPCGGINPENVVQHCAKNSCPGVSYFRGNISCGRREWRQCIAARRGYISIPPSISSIPRTSRATRELACAAAVTNR